jgi:hypothetical protein
MILHNLFGRHVADHQFNRWEGGYFVSKCAVCGQALIKLPGLPWRLRPSSA